MNSWHNDLDLVYPFNQFSYTGNQSNPELQVFMQRCPWDDWHPVTDIGSFMDNQVAKRKPDFAAL